MNDSESLSILRNMESYLREIVSYQKRDLLRSILVNPEEIAVYELSDGTHTSEEIADHENVSKTSRTVRRWWSDWEEKGLVTRLPSGNVLKRYDITVLEPSQEE